MAKIKELFASTLNGILASGKSVSSIIVVLNAKFAHLLASHAGKEDGEKRRSPTKCRVLLLTFITVSTVNTKKRVNYILSNNLCKLIDI